MSCVPLRPDSLHGCSRAVARPFLLPALWRAAAEGSICRQSTDYLGLHWCAKLSLCRSQFPHRRCNCCSEGRNPRFDCQVPRSLEQLRFRGLRQDPPRRASLPFSSDFKLIAFTVCCFVFAIIRYLLLTVLVSPL